MALGQPSANSNTDNTATAPPQCRPERKPACNAASPFRTLDGTCNNLRKPLWASADYPQARMGKASYQDGISAPRTLSVTSRPSRPVALPSAREVSTALSKNRDAESPATTFMLVQFAQFIAHDISNSEYIVLKSRNSAFFHSWISSEKCKFNDNSLNKLLFLAPAEKVLDPNNSSKLQSKTSVEPYKQTKTINRSWEPNISVSVNR